MDSDGLIADKELQLLNDAQVYDFLDNHQPENELDLSDWYGHEEGPRARGLSKNTWTSGSRRREWQALLSKVPEPFAFEISYCANRILDFSCRIHPHFEILLANHVFAEWLLYANLDHYKYREHLVHPFKVAGVARWLLEETGSLDRIRKQLKTQAGKRGHLGFVLQHWGLTPRVFEGKDGEKIIKAALWIACLFHDLGYGHHFMCQLEKRLEASCDFYSGDIVGGSIAGMSPDLVERSILRCHLDLDSKPEIIEVGKYAKPGFPPRKSLWQAALYENLPLNHSIAGAINLLCLLQGILDYWPDVNPRLVLTFELAAEAILLHDLAEKDNYGHSITKRRINSHSQRPEICLARTPIAVLLILADEIQCWGRPRLEYRSSRSGGGYSDNVTIDFKPERDGVYYLFEPVDQSGQRALRIDMDVWEKLDEMELSEDEKKSKGQRRKRFWDGLLLLERAGKSRKADCRKGIRS